MILQELVHYYERKAADPDSGIAPEGWEIKEIPFVIVIDQDGNFVQLEDTRSGEGKKKVGRRFLVPQDNGRTGSKFIPNLFWDKASYIFGFEELDKNAQIHLAAFKKMVDQKSKLYQGHTDICAVKKFYESSKFNQVKKDQKWEECSKIPGCILSFRLTGKNDLVCQNKELVEDNLDQESDDSVDGICLVTGQKAVISRTHTKIKNLFNQKKYGPLVSFQINQGYDSYGKIKAYNAPTGKSSEFAYSTALNHLLRRDSHQKMRVGDVTAVFWANKKDNPMEDIFAELFNEPSKDDPDRNTNAVESLYKSPQHGYLAIEDHATKFFVLGLSPNDARISVRFWLTGTVAEFAEKIRRHFDDIAIIHREYEPSHLSIFRLLVATALADNADNIAPNLGGEVMRAALSDLPYPQTLLQGAIRRIRAEQAKKDKRTGKLLANVTYARAAIVKACLNRQNRFTQSNTKELTVSLDPDNTHPAYLLGRLFAILEKVQKDAQPGINATIRDRFYGSFSSSPASVFAILMRLKNHHLAKLGEGSKTYYEKMIGDIVALMPSSGVPAHLPLADQGRFAIGYYHQNHALYTKQDKGEKNV